MPEDGLSAGRNMKHTCKGSILNRNKSVLCSTERVSFIAEMASEIYYWKSMEQRFYDNDSGNWK